MIADDRSRIGNSPNGHVDSTRIYLAFITIIGLLLRLAWLIYATPYPTSSDPAIYYHLAEVIAEHQAYAELKNGELIPHIYFLPGFSAFLSIFLLIHKSFLSTAIANALASTLLIPITFFFAKTIGSSRTTGLIAASLCAIYPGYIIYGPACYSENLFSTLLFASFALLITKPDPTILRLVVAGTLLAFACLVRGEGLFYLPALLLAATNVPTLSLASIKSGLKIKLLILPLMVFIALSAWTYRNSTVAGAPILSSTSGLNFYLAHNDEGYGWQDYFKLVETLANADSQTPITYGSPASSQYFLKLGIEHLKQKPASLFGDIASGTYNLYKPTAFGLFQEGHPIAATLNVLGWPIVVLLSLLSLLQLKTMRLNLSASLVLVILMNWLCYAVVFWAQPRYRFAIEEIAIVLTAMTIAGIYKKRSSARNAHPA